MKLEIMSTAICRTPAFGTEDRIEDVWEELKEKIMESSPAFHSSIAHIKSAELGSIDKKLWFTIWKYFTRSKYRGTPFGSFSALSLVEVAHRISAPIISSDMLSHSFPDWGETDLVSSGTAASLGPSTLIYKNSSLYYIGDQIRYIRAREGNFEIGSVVSFPELLAIVQLCEVQQKLSEILKAMKSSFALQARDTTRLIGQMLALQLLVTDSHPNITGTEYFARMDSTGSPNGIRYVISERKLVSGGLDSSKLRELPELIDFLALNLPPYRNQDLEDFTSAFRKRFELREVPLSLVMDPETGLGYGNLEQQPQEGTIGMLRSGKRATNEIQNIPYSQLHTFVLDGMISGRPVQLEQFVGPMSRTDLSLPNTLSLIIRFWKGRPVIESAGGTTANALLGRFTLLGHGFEDFARSIAAIEEQANPEVIFFDIAYQAEKKIDNVNRRKMIYATELPILSWSCSPEPLDFNDIMVSVNGNKIVLRSKKHGKRLVPRIPSAYNYSRSDLAAYRFLCDLQGQHIRADLRFSPRDYFPNLKRYPRVSFKNVIVSPAMWKVPESILDPQKKAPAELLRAELLHWLEAQGIDFVFRAGDTDSTLCFDPARPWDLDVFLMYCRQHKKGSLYISEALMADADLCSEDGKSFAPQYVVSYCHRQPLYEKILQTQTVQGPLQGSPRVMAPGREWLYYQIYCYPGQADSLLANELKDLLGETRPYLDKWFFIRYDQPGHHLRLRLQVSEPLFVQVIVQKLNVLIEPYLLSGQVSELGIASYNRELERYGPDRMDAVEAFFHRDSEYAMLLIAAAEDIQGRYVATIKFIKKIFLADIASLNDQVIFVKQMADSFAAQIDMQPEQFRELNDAFGRIRGKLEGRVPLLGQKRTRILVGALHRALQGTTGEPRSRLMADLIHMHVNRLFPFDQRLHETILYHYLLRQLMADRARGGYQVVRRS